MIGKAAEDDCIYSSQRWPAAAAKVCAFTRTGGQRASPAGTRQSCTSGERGKPPENEQTAVRNRAATDPKASDRHSPGDKKHPCGAATRQPAKPSSPVTPAWNADSLDDVDRYLAEEDEKEDEEAEGAVRPAGEKAAGVRPTTRSPHRVPALRGGKQFQGTPFARGKLLRGGDFRRNLHSNTICNTATVYHKTTPLPSAKRGEGSSLNTQCAQHINVPISLSEINKK